MVGRSNSSAPFGKSGHNVRTPVEAAQRLHAVIGSLVPDASGGFFEYWAKPLPW